MSRHTPLFVPYGAPHDLGCCGRCGKPSGGSLGGWTPWYLNPFQAGQDWAKKLTMSNAERQRQEDQANRRLMVGVGGVALGLAYLALRR
jgi:hypothetical protein